MVGIDCRGAGAAGRQTARHHLVFEFHAHDERRGFEFFGRHGKTARLYLPRRDRRAMSVLPLKADMLSAERDVRFVNSGLTRQRTHVLIGRDQAILPPPALVMASTEGRGGILGSKSGQRVAGSLNVEGRPKPISASAPSAPGCCTAMNKVSPSGVKQGPQTSAPMGQRKKSLDFRRRSPSVSRAKRPSDRPVRGQYSP